MNLTLPERIRLRTMLAENNRFKAPSDSRLMNYLAEMGLVRYVPADRDWILTSLGYTEASKEE